MSNKAIQLKAFERLLTIIDELREKCPWDKKQTISSLRPLTIEEVYELGDAIIENDIPEIKKELGDVLMHLVFYAKIASEKNAFNITDVINSVCDKLVFRHPHVYGDVKVQNEEEVKQNWEKLKIKEGNTTVLEGVPKSLPSLVKAIRIQEKVAGIGFDWEKTSQVLDKVNEEINELKAELNSKNQDKIEQEFGDVIFSLINYARFINVNPENALERTNKKFIKRFQLLEKEVTKSGYSINDLSLNDLNAIWEKTKLSD